ncbi:ArsC/Spx/MgsR family protein [Maricaulis parjimensis]|uniref:ArsC/Spx/MgsR family protein n=1 Tax=Maricaulis parjimensis TaxID=144023 RepID=UPI00193A61B2|nr:ArsC/Spx/MgsR family protein [Maricaulis parjimensis]
MRVTIYGLKNCDTCRKAVKDVEAAGLSHQFVDIRAEADNAVQVPKWLDAVGSKALVNTRSTTWRNMSDEERSMAETDPAGALISSPTLIKRPVIEAGQDVHVGWSASTLDALKIAAE